MRTTSRLRLERRLRATHRADTFLLEQSRRHFEEHYRGLTEPLVTVTIPTRNRSGLLRERSLPSVLAQTYSKIEVLIVGDHCTDDTRWVADEVGDPRVRFLSLSSRDRPTVGVDQWLVAGAHPSNLGLLLAAGEWIAHIDDDDIWHPRHVELLLAEATRTDAEFAFGQAQSEDRPEYWRIEGAAPFPTGRWPFRRCDIPHACVLYRSYLRFLYYDVEAYTIGDGRAADNLLWQRMGRAGVRVAFVEQVLARRPLRPGQEQAAWRDFLV